MPSKVKAGETGAVVSEEAVRQRAYFLWEADGRPDGTGDRYWHLALEEATKELVKTSSDGAARAGKGKSPGAVPEIAKASKLTKAKVKDGSAKAAKAMKAEAPKPAKAKVAGTAKPAKKVATKLRAALPAKK